MKPTKSRQVWKGWLFKCISTYEGNGQRCIILEVWSLLLQLFSTPRVGHPLVVILSFYVRLLYDVIV